MITHIHHINFLVRDLDQAIKRYQDIIDCGTFELDELPNRAVKTARLKLGQSWLVLVQPLDQHSVPAQHLADHGEGFFMLSLGTDDLHAEKQRIEKSSSFEEPPFATPVRNGIDTWRVLDFQMQHFFGAQLQLTEETKH